MAPSSNAADSVGIFPGKNKMNTELAWQTVCHHVDCDSARVTYTS